jgi:membrane protein YdbS with pleckstrin-like domain
MSKKEKIKEQIGWLKVVFGLLFASDISLIAYLYNSIEEISVFRIVIVMSALVVTTLAIIYVNKKAVEKIDSLEDL